MSVIQASSESSCPGSSARISQMMLSPISRVAKMPSDGMESDIMTATMSALPPRRQSMASNPLKTTLVGVRVSWAYFRIRKALMPPLMPLVPFVLPSIVT